MPQLSPITGVGPVGGANPSGALTVLQVDANGNVLTMAAGESAYTPRAPSGVTTLASGGAAITLCAAGEVTRGGLISNPSTAAAQNVATAESIFVNLIGTATTTPGGNVFEVLPGASFPLPPLTTAVSWTAATAGHKISVWVQ